MRKKHAETGCGNSTLPKMFKGVRVATVTDGGQELVVGGGVVEGLRVAEAFVMCTVRCRSCCLALIFRNPR